MTRSGGFPIKLLLLLQAKQTTGSSCSLLLLYGDLSQPLSSHPEEISGITTLIITKTHQPECSTLTKSAAGRAGTLRVFGFCWLLTALSQAMHFTAWLRIWHYQNPPAFQRKPIQKDESCQGIPASFVQ